MTISLTNTIQRADRISTSSIDDELVMMHLAQNAYYGVDAVGRRIWELLEHPIQVAHVLEQLQQEFEVSAEQCAADVLPFLGELAREKLIYVVA